MYARWFGIEDIPVGAYVQYNFPSSYTATALGENTGKGTYDESTGVWTWQDQTFTPSSYSSGWRVLYNNSGKLDIISTKSIGNLTLGTSYDNLSSETDPKLTGGKIAYAKAIETLNDLCNQYSKGLNKAEIEGGIEIAESGRAPGQGNGVSNIFNLTTDSNGDGYIDVDLNKDGKVDVDDITHANVRIAISTGLASPYLPYGDKYNDVDNNTDPEKSEVTRIATYIPYSNGSVWLASRNLGTDGGRSNFIVYRLGPDNSLNYATLYVGRSSSTSYATYRSGEVRPIITLKSGLKIVDGEGTVNKPYVLGF